MDAALLLAYINCHVGYYEAGCNRARRNTRQVPDEIRVRVVDPAKYEPANRKKTKHRFKKYIFDEHDMNVRCWSPV